MILKKIRKDDVAVSPVIAVILMVAITVVLAGVLYAWLINIGEVDTGGPSISKTIEDKGNYWKISIVRVSGGKLELDEAKFQLVTKSDTSLFIRTTIDINPTIPLESGDSKVYAIPSGSTPVSENSTTGDGEPVDVNSIIKPHIWEECYFTYVDVTSDEEISSGDTIWVYKDHDADGINDVTTGFAFKILDGRDNEVLKVKL